MALIANKIQEPIIFIVRGTNWTYEVLSDFHECQYILRDIDDRGKPTFKKIAIQDLAIEAATKAIEVFKGVVKVDDKFVLDNGHSEPYMGIALDVSIKNSPADTVYAVETYVCLANAGFYQDSIVAFNALIDYFYLENQIKKLPKEIETMVIDHYKNTGRKKPKISKKSKEK